MGGGSYGNYEDCCGDIFRGNSSRVLVWLKGIIGREWLSMRRRRKSLGWRTCSNNGFWNWTLSHVQSQQAVRRRRRTWERKRGESLGSNLCFSAGVFNLHFNLINIPAWIFIEKTTEEKGSAAGSVFWPVTNHLYILMGPELHACYPLQRPRI